MTIEQAFKHLLDNWEFQSKEYKDKFKSYRSKYINGRSYVGESKKKEMLMSAGYKIKISVIPP